MVEAIKEKVCHGRSLVAMAVVVFGLFILAGRHAVASETRTVPVTINTGEAYTIPDVSADSTPGVKVVSNPSALVVHTDAPGKIVLLGAGAGSWDINVTLTSGEKVTYAVDVKPAESTKGPLAAATNPPASSDPLPASATTASSAVSRPADTGSGPVDAAAATSGGAATVSAASAPATEAPVTVGAASAPVAAATAPSVPAAEPVRIASADPAGPVTAAPPPAA
ncbi:MAG: hypothetical protein WB999_13055, partial [Candidatus Binataceae bacterium]